MLCIVPIIHRFYVVTDQNSGEKVCQLSVCANYQCANYPCSQCMVSLYPKHGAFENVPIIRLCQLTVCQLSVLYCTYIYLKVQNGIKLQVLQVKPIAN